MPCQALSFTPTSNLEVMSVLIKMLLFCDEIREKKKPYNKCMEEGCTYDLVKYIIVVEEGGDSCVDPLQAMSEHFVHKQGFLTKQGGKVKNWKKRLFVLNTEGLSYYKTESVSFLRIIAL